MRHLFAFVLALGVIVPAAPATAEDQPITPFGTSECPANRFCYWTGFNYTGAMYALSGTGVARAIPTSRNFYSFYNNRSYAVKVYKSNSTDFRCYAPKAKVATVPSDSRQPINVFLMATTTC